MINKQYLDELHQIKASDEFKRQLKQSMIEAQNVRRTNFKPKLMIAMTFCLCILILFFSLQQNNEQLAKLDISSTPSGTIGGLGSVGNLGNDASLLVHNNPYTIKDNGDLLPVYKNINAGEEKYLSRVSNEELLPILENFAKKMSITDYTIETYDGIESDYSLNANIYLNTKYGQMTLISKNESNLLFNESHIYYVGAKTQAEVEKNIKEFIESTSFINFQNPWIDVYVKEHTTDIGTWNVRISETYEDEEENLISNQFHYIDIKIDQLGKIESISYVDIDTNDIVGDYPLKSLEEAKKELNTDASIDYVEIIYDKRDSDAYYLPYYKFYVLKTIDSGTFYEPQYVNAIQNEYLIR